MNLALVGAVVLLVQKLDLEGPVVGAVSVKHHKPIIVGVGEKASGEDVPVPTTHPRYTVLVVSWEGREATWQESCRADVELHVRDAVVAQLQLRQNVSDVAYGVPRVS